MAVRSRVREAVPRTPTRSPSAECVDDLDAIAIPKRMFAVASTRNDFPVHLHGHAMAGKLLIDEQVVDGRGGGKGERFAVEVDVHGVIVALRGRNRIPACRAAA